MSKLIKELMTAQVASRLEGESSLLVVSYQGIDANEMVELRSNFHKVNVTLTQVKNSIALRAFSRTGHEEASRFIDGPCAVACGGESVVDLAKAVHEYARKNKQFKIKGGVVEGQAVTADKVETLARIPSREALYAQIAGCIQAPMRNLVGGVNAVMQKMAGLFDAYKEKLESGGEVNAAASEG